MSSVLVVYATKSGCTAGIADEIGKALTGAGVKADVLPAADRPDPATYDAVIVGSGVRVAQWHASAREWLAAHAETLKNIPVALFTACLTMATEPEKAHEVRAYTDTLVAETGIEPVDVGLFAGSSELGTFSLPERIVLKVMKAPQGDFRDYEAVAAWTRETAGKLGVS